jgi:hypothetical protein
MTCILGLEHADGSAWLAGDRYFGDENIRDVMDAPKIVRRGAVAYGFCGGMREGQFLEHLEPPRAKKRGESIEAFIREAVVAPMLTAQNRAGLKLTEDFNGLVAVAGKVYAIESDGGFYRSAYGYIGIGAAASYAVGSLASTGSMAPEERLTAALRAAERHSPCCMAPFDLLRLPR